MLPPHIEKWTNANLRAKYPEHVKNICRVYNKYFPIKEQFIDRLNGVNPHREESLMKGLTAEDSKELQSSLSKLIPTRLYVKRVGRGHRHGNPRWGSYLPLNKSESYAVYIYKRYNYDI